MSALRIALAAATAALLVVARAAQADPKEILDRHNSYRARHQAGPLSWSDSLARGAQDWANGCNRQHSQTSDGENLGFSSPFRGASSDIVSAIDRWYNEADKYDFNKPDFSPATGHFTQVVWRGTTQVGCGIKQCGDWAHVVCRYSPPGNWKGQFAQNVLAKKG